MCIRDRQNTLAKDNVKNVRNSKPVTLTKDAILKHQSKDVLAEALEDKKTNQPAAFIFGLLIVLSALLVYNYSKQLISILPESETYVASYIELIDRIRLELNKLVGKVTHLIISLI